MAPNEPIQILSRALRLLDVLSRQDSPRTLAEIATLAELPKSTTHRLLQALAAEDFVSVHSLGRYAVGRAQVCVGARSLRGGILIHAEPDAKLLRDATNQTVFVTTLYRLEVVFVGKYPGTFMPKMDIGTGPAPFSASGKAMLACLPWEEVLERIKKYGLSSRTHASNTDIERLRAELERARAQGYAFAKDEYTAGVSSLGAPIFDYSGECAAGISLSIVMPASDADVLAHAPELLKTAKSISERMGYLPPAECS